MLPKHVERLFKPRLPLPYAEPCDVDPKKRRTRATEGLAGFLGAFAEQMDEYVPTKTALQIQIEERIRKREAAEAKLKRDTAQWDPHSDPLVRGNPYATLFVGRLSYSVDEADLERELRRYGPISRIRVVRDATDKSRGYAFVVFEDERDARNAAKEADGTLLKGRRIVTDLEKGRCEQHWRPRRLGGGCGGRNSKKEQLLALQQRTRHSFVRQRGRPPRVPRNDRYSRRPNSYGRSSRPMYDRRPDVDDRHKYGRKEIPPVPRPYDSLPPPRTLRKY